MYVRRVELTDFRSYERVAVDLDPGVTVLVGQNGMGKTNLVEALGYVATLDSHRVATDAPLVRAGAASAVIRCAIVHDGRELLVELEIVPGKANRARLNRSPVRRAREVLGALRMVLFAPEDLELVRGDPSERRQCLVIACAGGWHQEDGGGAERACVLGKGGALAGIGRADSDDYWHASPNLVDDHLGEAKSLLARHPRRFARLPNCREAVGTLLQEPAHQRSDFGLDDLAASVVWRCQDRQDASQCGHGRNAPRRFVVPVVMVPGPTRRRARRRQIPHAGWPRGSAHRRPGTCTGRPPAAVPSRRRSRQRRGGPGRRAAGHGPD